MMLAGAIPTALLAVLVDFAVGAVRSSGWFRAASIRCDERVDNYRRGERRMLRECT